MKSRLEKSRHEILKLFNHSDRRTFMRSDLAAILAENRDSWKLPLRLTVHGFVDFLMKVGSMQKIVLSSSKYTEIVRYTWGESSPYEIALSLRKHAYLCHATALLLHGLTDQLPKTVYINSEQSPKPRGGLLTQEAMDKAFSRDQRK